VYQGGRQPTTVKHAHLAAQEVPRRVGVPVGYRRQHQRRRQPVL